MLNHSTIIKEAHKERIKNGTSKLGKRVCYGYSQKEKKLKKRLRVAAYCRVSTETDDQAASLQTQIKNYESEIRKNPDWDFVGVYCDIMMIYVRKLSCDRLKFYISTTENADLHHGLPRFLFIL